MSVSSDPSSTPAIEPAPDSAPARHRAETRRRLVAAATELFAREGLRGTTSTQIARAAGVAAGTFYLHFADKEALFREIAFGALAELRARMDAAHRAAAAAGPSLEAPLRARMAELVAFAEERRDLVRIVFGRGHEAGTIGEEMADELFPGVEARLRERISEGRADPGLHPAVAAQALIASWTRIVAWWVEDPSRASREDVVETLVRLHPVFTHQITHQRAR
jgi:AcrR family transcriptional regulator